MFLGLLPLLGYAQQGKLNKAHKQYEKLGFIRASEIYEEVASKGYRSVELLQRLGNTYYFNANYQKAAPWYKELFALDSSISPAYYRRYAQSLKAIGEDTASERIYNLYVQRRAESSEAALTSSDYLNKIAENSGRYTIDKLPFNSEGIDFGGIVNNGKLYYASTKDTGTLGKRKSAWDGLAFLDIYQTGVNSDGTYGSSSKIEGDVNTRFHESTPWVTKDGKTMYFTRNNTTPKEKKKKGFIQHLKIYRASLVDGKWKNIENLSINGDHYSTAHPVLNSKEDRLYFVSDRPGSIGATDIFYCEINSDGSLGRVKNAGEIINTRGRESFPFITERDELYFSSDGHFGLGGYDVFYVQLSDNENILKESFLNVGEPINSAMDDVAFTINTSTHNGFISSNRDGGLGYDDIYSFTENTDVRKLLLSEISGTVVDRHTGEPLGQSEIELFFEDGSLFTKVQTDSNGYYRVGANRNVIYVVRASKEGYSSEESFSLKGKKSQVINFELERDLYELASGGDLAKMLGIKEIYFDFDKSNIRPDAEVELQKVITVMEQYPKLTIAIRSHTDSRGNDNYNLKLSDQRARSTKNYLISHGIDTNRLSAKGVGEQELVNRCVNGVKCPDEQHQENRRSEFIIGVIVE